MSPELTTKVRLVRCPKCRQLLAELPEILVYMCGGCGVTLQAKSRINGLRSERLNDTEAAQRIRLDCASEDRKSRSSGCNAALPESGECFSDQENECDQIMSSEGNESSESGDCFSNQENERDHFSDQENEWDQIMSSEGNESSKSGDCFSDQENERDQIMSSEGLSSTSHEFSHEIGRLLGDLEVTKERLKGLDEEIVKLKDEHVHRIPEGAHQRQGLEAQIDLARKHVLELEERIVRCNADILGRDLEVMQLKSALHDTQEQFSLEKANLEADISSFSEKQILLDTRVEELSFRSKSLEDGTRQCEMDKMEMERLHVVREMALQDEISRLKVEVADRNGHVEAVKKELDSLKLKYDMLTAEKDELNARTQTLMANVSSRDNQIQEMVGHLSLLRTEHEGVIVGSECAHRLVDELKSRVEELQQEVNRQSVVISDGAEEKREVIRQLCFSLEHYRSGYQELRQAFTGHRRRAVAAA